MNHAIHHRAGPPAHSGTEGGVKRQERRNGCQRDTPADGKKSFAEPWVRVWLCLIPLDSPRSRAAEGHVARTQEQREGPGTHTHPHTHTLGGQEWQAFKTHRLQPLWPWWAPCFKTSSDRGTGSDPSAKRSLAMCKIRSDIALSKHAYRDKSKQGPSELRRQKVFDNPVHEALTKQSVTHTKAFTTFSPESSTDTLKSSCQMKKKKVVVLPYSW